MDQKVKKLNHNTWNHDERLENPQKQFLNLDES